MELSQLARLADVVGANGYRFQEIPGWMVENYIVVVHDVFGIYGYRLLIIEAARHSSTTASRAPDTATIIVAVSISRDVSGVVSAARHAAADAVAPIIAAVAFRACIVLFVFIVLFFVGGCLENPGLVR